jgi:hypothetical protein
MRTPHLITGGGPAALSRQVRRSAFSARPRLLPLLALRSPQATAGTTRIQATLRASGTLARRARRQARWRCFALTREAPAT